MNKTEAGALYAQAIDFQSRLVRRGKLFGVGHDIADARECADGSTLVECTCGRGMFRSYAESERAFAQHVIDAVRKDLAVAA